MEPPRRVKVLLKGAAAAIFAVHELRLAHNDALIARASGATDALGSASNGLESGSRTSRAPSTSSQPASLCSSESGLA